MRINNNLMAMNTHRQLGINSSNGAKSIEKLSSGYRINRAGDDAAGLAISEKMRGQIRGLSQASRNSQDAISLVQTAEGALNETQDILQRMRELAVQSASDTNVSLDRDAIQNEVDQLASEIDRIANTTEFNTKKLLNGKSGVTGTILSNPANGSFVSGNENTTAGTYTITIDTNVASKAVTAAGTTDFSVAQDVSADALAINGVNIDFSGMTNATTADIVSKINEYSSSTGVVATGTTTVSLSQTSFGSSYGITVSGAQAAEYAGAVTAGVDVRVDVSGDAVIANVNGDGQRVAFAAGTALEGVVVDVTGAANGAAFTLAITQGSLKLQIGANEGQELGLSLGDMRATALGVSGIDISNQASASTAITTINDAITSVSTERAKMGAVQNRLEHTIKNLDTSAENLQASESRIRDVDMAKEMMNFTKNNILQQAAQAMLAQANQQPQGVLQLLR